jgi:hypothetical protein
MITKPLYGHTSEETSYVVEDYPYGFRLRTRIVYWIEKNDKKGFRFVSMTYNPKSLKWNAPKRSTYSLIAECLYLDENEHVCSSALTEYSSAEECLTFAQFFPKADTSVLRVWALKKLQYVNGMLDGTVCFIMNGVKQETSEIDKIEYAVDKVVWERVCETLRSIK